MSKYGKLQDYLEGQDGDVIEMTVEKLEAILGFTLPPYSARGEYWANEIDYEAPNRHAQDRAWQRAGFRAQRLFGTDIVRFVRKKPNADPTKSIG